MLLQTGSRGQGSRVLGRTGGHLFEQLLADASEVFKTFPLCEAVQSAWLTGMLAFERAHLAAVQMVTIMKTFAYGVASESAAYNARVGTQVALDLLVTEVKEAHLLQDSGSSALTRLTCSQPT